VQRFQDSLDDLPSYVQTGLAKWVVPGLETSLEKMLVIVIFNKSCDLKI
jgi:hypothetical protein